MARLFVAPERLTGQTVTLDGEDHRYLTRVLRLAVGHEVEIFDGGGIQIDGRIAAVGARATEVALGQRRQVPLPRVFITLLQAVPRGDRMDWIVQKATELGVGRIVPALTSRSVARPAAAGRPTRWRTIAEEAARQSGRADVPVIDAPLPLAEALVLPVAPDARRLMLFEGVRDCPLRGALTGHERDVLLLVGPEGGFAPDEVTAARVAGFGPVGLGARILRVETAALVALTLVQAAVGALD